MKLSFIQRFRLWFIKFALEVLTVLDLLETSSLRTFKFLVSVFLLLLFVMGGALFLVKERSEGNIYRIAEYLIVPKPFVGNTYSSVSYPIMVQQLPFPQISARSYLVVDLKSKKELSEFNSRTPLPPASTTKLMTAIVARELYELSDEVTIPKECVNLEGMQQVGFIAGEKVLARDLIGSVLVSSGGDSACALARSKIPYSEFISKMNAKAVQLEMRSSYFSNPIGVDDFSENHLSSAYDLYLLTLQALKDPFLQELVATKEYDINSGLLKRKIFNTNDLLWDISGTSGVKTGRTYGAGEVLIYTYSKDNADLLIIVMGSLNRFKDTTSILNWTLSSYSFGGN